MVERGRKRAAARSRSIISSKESASDAALLAVSPIDGRYRSKLSGLEAYFSEFALIRYRARVEIEWYLSLAAEPKIDAIGPLSVDTERRLRAIYQDFSIADARRVKDLEAGTKHDVKAVEYFLKQRLAELDPKLPVEMMHFACTSEDINNLAYALILKEFVAGYLQGRLEALVDALGDFADRYRALPMLARTHGQTASPTTMGKEFAIFAARLERQLKQLRAQEFLGKANGAVGNFNAHHFAYPEVDWIADSRRFVEGLGLQWNPLTTQIESHDFMAELFDLMARISTILLGLARDLWGYVAIGYLRQRAAPGEVGSSVMPHKVNPIDFENCEGNAGLAVASFQHLAAKLPVSRWQRDLSDSTVLRSAGTAFAQMATALASLVAGLDRVDINAARIAAELADEQAWEVVGEALQTLMRRHGLPRPYEALKELTRGRQVSRQAIAEFIETLPLEAAAKQALRRLTPQSYTGLAAELVERFAPGRRGK